MRAGELAIAFVAKGRKKLLDVFASARRTRHLFLTENEDFKVFITFVAMVLKDRHYPPPGAHESLHINIRHGTRIFESQRRKTSA